jgi:uncharacterized coiled-coil DUF342 family protein
MTIEHKIKTVLSANEALHRELSGWEQMCAELKSVQGKIEAAKAELAELENNIERTRRMAGEADGQHSAFVEASTRERERCNKTIDQMHQELEVLNAQVKERRLESDNILQGLKALKERLVV